MQTGADTNDSVMALLYNEEEYTWKVKRPLSGSHIGIRILLPQIQTPMGSGYVPLLTDQGLPRSVRMLWRNTSYPKASTRMQTRDSAVLLKRNRSCHAGESFTIPDPKRSDP